MSKNNKSNKNNKDNEPMTQEQRNALAFYMLGVNETLDYLENGVTQEKLRESLYALGYYLMQGEGNKVAPRLKDFLN